MMRQFLYGKMNLKMFELKQLILILLKKNECKIEEYFIIMKKKIGGVDLGFQKICLNENFEDQILRCFGIFELI
jgi:hypothetical protein